MQTDRASERSTTVLFLSIRQMFRYVEWIVIAVYVFYYVLLAAKNILSFTAELFWQLSFFYVAIAVYCIIAEELTNIQKHSNADRIYLQ